MIIVMKTTLSTGREQRHRDAAEDLPLGRAVGARGLEHVARHRREPGADHDHREAGPDPDVGDQQRRGDQARPEPGEAAERLREGLRADRRLVAARATFVKSNVPSGSDLVDFTVLPAADAQLDGHARQAELLPLSTTPGLPPPGVKSRQTTPTIVARLRRRLHRLDRALRHGGRRDAREREQRDAARCERRLQHERAARGRLRAAGSRGTRCEQDARRREDAVDAIGASALIAPRPGSCWYMIRQVTPVAKAEIAIGRKTAVLNATAQRMFSVRTAKIRPIAVTSAGTTATQIALFLIAVVSVEVVKSVL